MAILVISYKNILHDSLFLDANAATASPSYWAYSNPTNPTEQPQYPSTAPQYPLTGPQYSVSPQEAPPYPTGM